MTRVFRVTEPGRLITAMLACAATSVGCGPNVGGAPSSDPRPAAAPPTVEVVRVVEQPLDVHLSLPGELMPYQSVAVQAKVAGFVKVVHVDRGARVRAGQLLAELEAPELASRSGEARAGLLAAQAQLAAARAKAEADIGTFERLTAASATPGVVAGNDVLVAQKAVDADRSQVLAAEQHVESARHAVGALRDLEGYLRIDAPFDGVVTERTVHPGALVGPGGEASTPLLRIVDQTKLRLVVPVPEAYTGALATGTELQFSVAAFPGESFTGTVARLARAVDVTTRTMAVELDVPNRDDRLAPGTFCQVRWRVTRKSPSLFVPAGSVASTTDRVFVVRIREGRSEWVDVKPGLTTGSLVEVFGDLRAGDLVASRGTDELRPGTDVRTRDAKPPG